MRIKNSKLSKKCFKKFISSNSGILNPSEKECTNFAYNLINERNIFPRDSISATCRKFMNPIQTNF